ncbi:Palmitoyltransferase [Caenorhabditis elegans]|uniref:Palmitoyltransferase n=1 Tax=Caenorhabditis elegans TaxID=6239 RepID=G5EDL2_CAEEL|nr:Palmitoyltransferase [Caenorhabditis elegans]CBI63250.1 Palmitoyltransferase [Caenorhabditis elegans]|eukprot:NP_001255040.1 Palmitoyltransferase [Caenorhabditis elegans]
MSCRDCTRKGGCVYTTFWLVRFLPVVLVSLATGWGIYAYTYELCILSIDNWPQRIIYLFIFYALLILFYTSYLRTVYTKAWKPPQKYCIEGASKATYESVKDDERQLQLFLSDIARERDLTLLVRGFDHGIRFCDKCCCIKPDRSHHCSMCEQCVLKFDHHCPWVNNCVNFGNYKYFILFLAYGFIFCIWIAATTLPSFIDFWRHEYDMNKKNGRFPLVFLLFLSCMFSLSLSFLFFYHLYLTAKNRTTVESFRAPMIDGKYAKDAFNHGIRANYREIFGSHPLYWFLPVPSSIGDGCKFVMNDMTAMSAAAGNQVFVEMGNVPNGQSHAHPPIAQHHINLYSEQSSSASEKEIKSVDDEITERSQVSTATTASPSHDSVTA